MLAENLDIVRCFILLEDIESESLLKIKFYFLRNVVLINNKCSCLNSLATNSNIIICLSLASNCVEALYLMFGLFRLLHPFKCSQTFGRTCFQQRLLLVAKTNCLFLLMFSTYINFLTEVLVTSFQCCQWAARQHFFVYSIKSVINMRDFIFHFWF